MREVIKAADRQVDAAWRATYRLGRSNAERDAALSAARAAARADLRAQWAAADNRSLPDGFTRITSEELQAQDRLAALRNAYVAALRPLSPVVRAAELHRLTNQLERP